MKCDPEWCLYKPLGGHCSMKTGEGPRKAIDEVSGALSIHAAPHPYGLWWYPQE
jgi:hypothetical protein